MSDQGDFLVHVDSRVAGETVVSVSGEVDLSTVSELEVKLLDAARNVPRLVVDLSGCTFLSSTGLRALLDADGLRGKDACRIVVVVPDPHIRKLFEIAGVESLFVLVDRDDEPRLGADAAVS